jgi:RNA polymerase sigma-70 factor (ECF subfamily)
VSRAYAHPAVRGTCNSWAQPDNMSRMDDRGAAYEQMLRARHAAVYRYVLRRVEGPAVEDVVGETFLVAWRRFDELAGDPLPWLLGIARRLCANHLRGRARRAALGARLEAESHPSVESDADVADAAILLALASLREADREALLLIAWDGLSNPHAAKVLGCSVGAFAVRLHRARRRLARELEAVETRHVVAGHEEEVAHELP